MKDRPLVSIIIPTYQAEQYVGEAVRSVLTQTWTNLEVVVVNDGSTDGTRLLLDWMAREDSRMQLIHQPHAGHHAARNVGLAMARGAFLGFLDADDLMSPDKIARHLAAFERMPYADMTYGDHIRFSDATRQRKPIRTGTPPLPLPELFVYRNWFAPFSPLLRRSLADRVGPFDERFGAGEDWDYWFRCVQRGTIAYVPGTTGLYRVHAGQVHRDRRAMMAGHIRFAHKHFADEPRKRRACLASLHAQEAKEARERGAWTHALRHFSSFMWHAGGFRHAMQVWSLLA